MGWTGKLLVLLVVSATVGWNAPARAEPWCGTTPSPFPLGTGDPAAAETDPTIQTNLWSALCEIAEESGEPIAVRLADDGRAVIVWSRSLEQHVLAQRVLAPFPSEVVRTVFSAAAPVVDDGNIFVFDQPVPPGEWAMPSGISEIEFAGPPPSVQDMNRARVAGSTMLLAAVAGGVYWRSRIGLRAYAGVMAVTLGAGVALFSIITDSLGAATPGFGGQQVAGLVIGLVLLDVGVIALRGQAKRFRSPLVRAAESGPRTAGGSRP